MAEKQENIEKREDREIILHWGGDVDTHVCKPGDPLKLDINGFINNFEALGYIDLYFEEKVLMQFKNDIASGEALVKDGDKRLSCREGVWKAYGFDNNYEAIGFMDFSCGPTRVEKMRYGIISTLPEQLRPKTRPTRVVGK